MSDITKDEKGDEDGTNADDDIDSAAVSEIEERPNPYINTPEGIAHAMAYFKLDVNAIMALGNGPKALGSGGNSGNGAVGARGHLSLVRSGANVVDTASTPWGIALRKLGRLGPGAPDGRHAVWCLRDVHHGTPVGSLACANTSCVLMPPTDVVGSLLLCSHSSCEKFQADDWLNELETMAPGTWEAATAEAAEIKAREAIAEAAARTAKRVRIVIQRRTVQRDNLGRSSGALIERTTLPDLSKAGLDALALTIWGSRAFVLENSNPPCMVHVIVPESAPEVVSGDIGGSADHVPRARVVTTTRNVLRGWFSGAAAWVIEGAGKTGTEVHEQDPPDAVVNYALELCDGLKPLAGITECPVMRRDGSILATPGYDAATHLYAAFDTDAAARMLASIPEQPTQIDASQALAALRALVRDFPFETDAHVMTWVAMYLTMLARDVFHGPSPLGLVRANTRGTGKTLLTEIPHILVTGERPAMLGWSGDETEFEKQVTTEALAGSACIVIDNVTGSFKSATLDRILTSGKHRARILGGNKNFDGPMRAVWWASGNNIDTSDDMASRRIAPIELVSRTDRPEDRTGFDADGTDGESGTAALRAKVRRKRWEYLAAGLTILRTWHMAGRPCASLSAWGSFESWSRVVRGAIVHAGGVDPGVAHEEFRDAASTDVGHLRGLLEGWQDATQSQLLSPDGEPLGRVVKKLIAESAAAEKDNSIARGMLLREALESLANGESLEKWRGQSDRVGKFFRSNRRKVIRMTNVSLMLDVAGESRGSTRWKVSSPQKGPADQGGDGGNGGDSPYGEMAGPFLPSRNGMAEPPQPHHPPTPPHTSNSEEYGGYAECPPEDPGEPADLD